MAFILVRDLGFPKVYGHYVGPNFGGCMGIMEKMEATLGFMLLGVLLVGLRIKALRVFGLGFWGFGFFRLWGFVGLTRCSKLL